MLKKIDKTENGLYECLEIKEHVQTYNEDELRERLNSLNTEYDDICIKRDELEDNLEEIGDQISLIKSILGEEDEEENNEESSELEELIGENN